MDTSVLHLDAMISEGFRGDHSQRLAGEGVSFATQEHERECVDEQYQTAKALLRRDLWIPVGNTDVLARDWRHTVRLDVEDENGVR